jgi:hypothetical protein
MPDQYLHRILPHIKDTFSDADISIVGNRAVVKNLAPDFNLVLEDNKIHNDDNFGFVKLKVPVENRGLNYDQLIQFITQMNHTHRGCHWALDTMSEMENQLYVYATMITELGRRVDDKDQIVMEILNLQKMKFLTDRFLDDLKENPLWLNEFVQIHGSGIIACLAPENFLNPEDTTIYKRTLKHMSKLNYQIEQINASSFKIVNEKGTLSVLTFLGPELVSLYSVITEQNKDFINLKKVLNERNQDVLMGHYEISPVQNIIGYTNYLRLAEGLRDIKIRLFLDSPDIAKMIYFDNESFAA